MEETANMKKSISEIKDEGTVNITATIKNRTQLKNWTRQKTSGTMMSGILEDNTGSIDFVCWTEASNKYDTVFIEDQTYQFCDVKAVVAKNMYSKTKHKYQIVIDKTSNIELIDCKPFTAPIEVKPIAHLAELENNDIATVVGRVINIPPPEKLKNTCIDIVKVKIQDSSASIQLSLIGNEIENCNFSIGDVLLLEKVQLRIYGPLRLLQGSTGIRTVNPKDRNLEQYLAKEDGPKLDLSPEKNAPMIKNTNTLNRADGRQQISTEISEINISDCIYDRCPKVFCRSRVILLNNNLYKCNKCETDYLCKSPGIRLIIGVNDDKKILMFNEMAESFLKKSAHDLEIMDHDDHANLQETMIGRKYNFIVGCTKTDNEFLCEKYEENQDELQHLDKPLPVLARPSKRCVDQKTDHTLNNAPTASRMCMLSTEKKTDVKDTNTKQMDENGNTSTVDDYQPLDLSFTSSQTPDITERVNFDISLPDTVETGSCALDLTISCGPSKKKFKFARCLDLDK